MPFGRPSIANTGLDGEFKVLAQLDVTQGDFNGGIFKVRIHRTREICIEKRFKPEHIEQGVAIREMNILRALNHPNITEYYHAFIEESPQLRASLFMEICDLGSLDDILTKYRQRRLVIGESFVWSAFMQLADAIGYIQYGVDSAVRGERPRRGWRKVIHRDIHPRNIFLQTHRGSQYPRVVLGDFGCGHFADSGYEEVGGSYIGFDQAWAPPESPAFGPPSDIWGMGAAIQDICRLNGSQSRRQQGAGNNYSAPLDTAIRWAMETDWHRRPRILDLAPQLRVWELEARVPVFNIPDMMYEHYLEGY
ncbi:hypothetical protein MMC30_002525 [Trapelia coarctata]|nr:hypothetical protein [Trapelia coarctata]